MSYLTFGEFALGDGTDRAAVEALAWRLFKHGAEQDVCLLFGCNIPQAIVFEMLGTQKPEPPTAVLPFLATASPLDDTSDGLVSPYSRIGPSGTDCLGVGESLQRLQSVFSVGLAESGIRAVTLFITEGYEKDSCPCSRPSMSFGRRPLDFSPTVVTGRPRDS